MSRQYQMIGEKIGEQIEQAGYRVGDRLPTEREYAERFAVSRTVVREAFIMLELAGRVEVRKGSGTYVTTPPPTGNGVATGNEDIGPFELLSARQAIESAVAANAASVITPADIRGLDAMLTRERRALESESDGRANGHEADRADRDFHLQIARATHNTLLQEAVERLWEQRDRSRMWRQLHGRIMDFSFRASWLADHERVLARLRTRDGRGAHDAMWVHLDNVMRTLFELSDTDDPAFDGYLFASPERGSMT